MCLGSRETAASSVLTGLKLCQLYSEPTCFWASMVMYIQKGRATIKFEGPDRNITQLREWQSDPYSVNIGDLFRTFAVPLTCSTVNFSQFQNISSMTLYDTLLPATDLVNSTLVDRMIDWLVYSVLLISEDRMAALDQALGSALTQALFVNSQGDELYQIEDDMFCYPIGFIYII